MLRCKKYPTKGGAGLLSHWVDNRAVLKPGDLLLTETPVRQYHPVGSHL